MNCVVSGIMIDDDKGGYDIKLLEFFANIKNKWSLYFGFSYENLNPKGS